MIKAYPFHPADCRAALSGQKSQSHPVGLQYFSSSLLTVLRRVVETLPIFVKLDPYRGKPPRPAPRSTMTLPASCNHSSDKNSITHVHEQDAKMQG